MHLVQLTDSPIYREVAFSLRDAQRVVVVTGAGISTPCGIPDFRSPDGLYSLSVVALFNILAEGLQDRVYDDGAIHFQFRKDLLLKGITTADHKRPAKDLLNTSIFSSQSLTIAYFRLCVLLREFIIQRVEGAGRSHDLLAQLDIIGKLLRCYTQNIDGLEARAGLLYVNNGFKTERDLIRRRCVQLHGDLHTVRCRLERCRYVSRWTPAATQAFVIGETIECDSCLLQSNNRVRQGRRALEIGSLRPNVVLYGEESPWATDIGRVEDCDLGQKPDALIVLGTSLKTDGARQLVKSLAGRVHQRRKGIVVMVNRSSSGASQWKDLCDYYFEAECDQWSTEIMNVTGWATGLVSPPESEVHSIQTTGD